MLKTLMWWLRSKKKKIRGTKSLDGKNDDK